MHNWWKPPSDWKELLYILGAIAGAVGTLTTLIRAQAAWLGLISFFVFIIFGWFIHVRFRHRRYPLSIIKTKKVLTLEDKSGKVASYLKDQIIRPNQHGVHRYEEQFWSDGTFDDPTGTLAGRFSRFNGPRRGGRHLYFDHVFHEPLKKGRSYRRTMTTTFRNCFLETTEAFVHNAYYPEGQVTIEIIFPMDRPPQNPRLIVRQGPVCFIEKQLVVEELNDRRKQIVWQEKHPHLHQEYRIEWDW